MRGPLRERNPPLVVHPAPEAGTAAGGAIASAAVELTPAVAHEAVAAVAADTIVDAEAASAVESSFTPMEDAAAFVSTGAVFKSGTQQFIVTNKHCLKDTTGAWLTKVWGVISYWGWTTEPFTRDNITRSWNSVVEWDITLLRNGGKLVQHPSLDLCAWPITDGVYKWNEIPAGVEHREARLCNLNEFFITHTANPFHDVVERLTTGESVAMIGYPNGYRSVKANLPVFRRGILAHPPAIDFRHSVSSPTGVGLLDIGLYGGSSGSPVFACTDASWYDGKDNTLRVGGSRPVLLGIVFAGPNIPAASDAPPGAAVTYVRMHLAHYVKASELMVLHGMCP